mgnify:CR=1 FL=1
MKLIKYFKIYLKLQKYNLQKLSIYKLDYFIGIITFSINQLFSILTLLIIFKNTISLGDWNYYQLLFLQGYISLIIGITDLLTDNLWSFAGTIIARGEFDKYLIKPIPSLLAVIIDRFQMEAIGSIIISSIIVIYSCIKMRMNLNLSFFVYILSSCLIIIAIKIIVASTAFKLKKSRALMYLIFKFLDFCKYPLTIYPKMIQFFLTILLPFGIASYYSVKSILNYSAYFSFIFLFLSLCLICLAIRIWNVSLRHYSSSGT